MALKVEMRRGTRLLLLFAAAALLLATLLLALLITPASLTAASAPAGSLRTAPRHVAQEENGAPVPGLTLSKTVGTDSSSCATTTEITVTIETDVTYCYEVTNTGGYAISTHTLTDTHLGEILTDFPYMLSPGASAFITASATLTETTVNTAAWTGFVSSLETEVTDFASARVIVVPPSLELIKTVGTDSGACATTTEIVVEAGATVTYCYEATNTGQTPLITHSLVDSQLGTILADFPYTLVPGASAFITASAVITEDVTNSAAWSARTAGGLEISDTATATVTVPAVSIDVEKVVAQTDSCAGAGALVLTEVGDVYYCFKITNTGDVAFSTHEIDDPTLGVLAVVTMPLPPGATIEVSNDQIPALGPVTITASITNTVIVTSTALPVALDAGMEAAAVVYASASAASAAMVQLNLPLVEEPDSEPDAVRLYLPLLRR